MRAFIGMRNPIPREATLPHRRDDRYAVPRAVA